MKPPMAYSGGKQNIAAMIVALMPPHLHYVEPYAGGLSVLFAKKPSHIETINDLDQDIMTFWRVLRDDPEGLERMCALTPHSRALLDQVRHEQGGTDVEKAWRVWVKITQSRGARTDTSSGWRFVHGTNRHSLSRYLHGYVARIAPAAERLSLVSLECRPALDVITAYDKPEALFYVDPPYLGETRHGTQYAVEMTDEKSHRNLLDMLAGCRGNVMLSGYRSTLYDKMLTDWTRVDLKGSCMTGATRTESLWINYTPPMVEEALL